MHRGLFRGLTLVFALASFAHQPACFAQAPSDADADLRPADCPPLPAFPQLVMTVVVSCQSGDSVDLTMPLPPDTQGRAKAKTVRGKYDFREYRITRPDQQERAFENLLQLIPMAGFTVKYSASPSVITARSADTWVLININGDSYSVSIVHEMPMRCAPPENVQQISRDMASHGRAAIHGLQFSPTDQSLHGKSSEILAQVLEYLKQSSALVIVESHRVSSTGTEADDFEITRERANAVVDWLIAHGIPASRLQAKPFGRMSPLAENDTPTNIQCNERIELARPLK